MPPDVFTLSDLKDILLIGPRSTFLRIGWASSASEWEVRWRLTRRLEQTGTLGALHDAAKRWGLDGAARPALSSSLLDRVLDAVRLGQLVGVVLPTVEIAASYGADIEAGRAALMAVRPERLRTAAGPQAGGPKPATGFALLPLEQRLATIVDRSETLLPASGRGLYRDVYQPGLLAKMVAALSFWAKTQDGATTPILSAVFWAGGTRSSTRRVVDTTADLVDMLDLACKAKTDTDADGAARHLARIIATVGAEDFIRIIQIVPDKIKGGGPVREVYVYPPIPPIVRPPQERPRRDVEYSSIQRGSHQKTALSPHQSEDLNVFGEKDGVSAPSFPDGNNQSMFGTCIHIQGSLEFIKMVIADLKKIESTPSGFALIKDISSTKHIVKIVEGKNPVGGNQCRASSKECFRKADGSKASGTSSTVDYYPKRDIIGTAGGWMTRPPAIGLAHELIHAAHNAKGDAGPPEYDNDGNFVVKDRIIQVSRINNDSKRNPSNPTKMSTAPVEEVRTVGIPPFDKEPYSENKIRSEWNPKQPLRPHY